MIPSHIKAGLTVKFSSCSKAYSPAEGWLMTLFLRGPQDIDLVGVANGDGFDFAASAATTSAWVAGQYWYSLRVTKGEDVHEIEAGSLTIEKDLATAGPGYDGRSQVKWILDAIEATLAKRATTDQERYRINNRELWRIPLPDLLKLRDQYRREYNNELRRKHGGSRFGPVVRIRI